MDLYEDQIGNNIVVINIVTCAALTMQTERMCLVVKQQKMRSLSDGVWREGDERDDSSSGVNYKNGRYTRHITFNKPNIQISL